jgi:hypothetical protein
MGGHFKASAYSLSFEQGISFNKCSAGLGINRFYVLCPCDDFLIENCAEMFYTICKRNVPSIQCRSSLRWSNLLGEVYCRNLLFIVLCSNAYTRLLEFPGDVV